MGILIPEPFYEALGVTEEMYHALALAGGIPAGLAALAGFVIRFSPPLDGQARTGDKQHRRLGRARIFACRDRQRVVIDIAERQLTWL